MRFRFGHRQGCDSFAVVSLVKIQSMVGYIPKKLCLELFESVRTMLNTVLPLGTNTLLDAGDSAVKTRFPLPV